jgi:3,4-dihydroxy 2-butanone 4-phosphate synthase/GTP cyclohydrolase II
MIQTAYGPLRLVTYADLIDGSLHIALVKGVIDPILPTLVRVHVLDTLRDVLRTERPAQSRGWPLHAALQRIAAEDTGVLVLVARAESADELASRLEIFPELPAAQAGSADKGPQFWRVNGTGSQILKDLGVQRMRLLSSPTRFSAISGFNLEITEFVENT